MRLITAACVLSIFAACGPVGAQSVPEQNFPRVRVKSPFAGPVWRVGTDISETFFAASNSYSSVTIWPAAAPDRESIFRAPLRDEQRKKAAPLAVSPDGELIVYGVPPLVNAKDEILANTSNIYVFRRSTSQILKTIGAAEDAVDSRPQALQFSPDGQYLAAVLSDGCGLRVWSTRDWKLSAKDDLGYGGASPAQARCCKDAGLGCGQSLNGTDLKFFGARPDGAWLITSSDTGVRIYGPPDARPFRKQLITLQQLALARPAGIAISPDGSSIAIGDSRDKEAAGPIRLRIALLNAQNFQPVEGAPFEITDRFLWSDAYLQDGPDVRDMRQTSFDRVAFLEIDKKTYLFAGGFFPCDSVQTEFLEPMPVLEQQSCLLRMEIGTQQHQWRFVPLDSERLMDLLAAPRHAGLLVATQRAIGLIGPDGTPLQAAGKEVFYRRNDAADFRGALLDLRISPDAKTVEFLDYRSSTVAPVRVTFDATNLSVRVGGSGGIASVSPDQDDGKTTIDEWRNATRPPLVLGTRLAGPGYPNGEIFRSISRSDERKLLLVGSSDFLRLLSYAAGKTTLLCSMRVREEAYRVVMTPDAKLAVTAHSDGTLRWYRIVEQAEGCRFELLLSAYLTEVRAGSWTWTAWKPAGTFARGVASRQAVEWQSDDTGGQIRRTPFENVTNLYDWAGVRAFLDPLGPLAANSGIIGAAAEKTHIQVLDQPNTNATSDATMPTRVRISDIGTLPRTIRLAMADGTPVPIARAGQAAADEGIRISATELDRGVAAFDIHLPAAARRKHGGKSFCYFLDEVRDGCFVTNWEGEIAQVPKRRLRAFLIGVAGHPEPQLRLKFADNDVIDIANLFIRDLNAATHQPAVDYQDVRIDLIVSPSSPEAAAELDQLKKQPFVTVRPATRAGIFSALEDAIADQTVNKSFPDDLTLLYFSGHGAIVALDGPAGGAAETVFATTETTLEPASLLESGLRAADLLKFFKQIPGQKLVMFDACRSLGSGSKIIPFDPVKLKMLFERDFEVHFFFSSDIGQFSVEVGGLAFDKTRAASRLGNSLFSYAILDAMTNAAAAVKQQGALQVVKIGGVAAYLENIFFNMGDSGSPAMQLKAQHPDWKYVPEPTFFIVRDQDANKVMRRLRP